MKKQTAYLLYCIVIFLSGCASEHADRSNVNVFRYNQPNHITSLDPAFAKSQNNIWAVDVLFNGLVSVDAHLNIVPCIAKRWEISPDGKQYVFHLRNDVRFHKDACFGKDSTRPVTAYDFVYSFSRIIDTTVNSPGSWIFTDKINASKPFEAVDDTTFIVRINEPFSPFLGLLSVQYCSVVPREAVDYYGRSFRSNPVGTGPFRFKKWIENQALFLVKNDDYFETDSTGAKLPRLDGIKISFINDRQIAYLELMNGKLDMISGLESGYASEVLDETGSLNPSFKDKIQYIKSPYLNTEYIGINYKATDKNSSWLKNKVFRQALNYAVNKEEMIRSLRNSVGIPANSGFVPFGLPSFDSVLVKGYVYNPAEAKRLLAKIGYFEPDAPDPVVTIYTNKDYADLITFIANNWQQVGIKTRIEVLETATLREMMRKGSVSMFRASWLADFPDAENYYSVFLSTNPAPPNYTRFASPAFDSAYQQAVRETGRDKTYVHYRQMEQDLIEEAPIVFLFYDQSSIFLNAKVRGFVNSALNIPKLQYVYFEK